MGSSGPQGQTEQNERSEILRRAEQTCELRHSPTRLQGGAAPKTAEKQEGIHFGIEVKHFLKKLAIFLL